MIALVMAPIVYSSLGAAVLAWGRDPRRMLLAPLAGVIAAGWLAELGFILGSAHAGVIVGAIFALMVLCVRKAAVADWVRSVPTLALLYVPAAIPALVVPYPGVALWYGDYLEYHFMGEAIRLGDWPAGLLHRPPLFGAATLFIRPFARDLQALQCVSAVSTLGALAVLQWATRCSVRSLWTVAATSFFFLHTATCWPKLLAAACVLTALVYVERRDASSRWAGAFWFAAAIAAHTASVIMAPLFVVRALRQRKTVSGHFLDGCRIAVACAVLPLPFEIWTTARFGLEARAKANPAVHYQRTGDAASNAAHNLWTTFVGWPDESKWSPPDQHRYPWLGPNFMKAAVYVTWSAGTILGILLPFAPLLWRRRKRIASWVKRYRWEFAAVFVVILFNAILNPMRNLSGVVQTGLTPLALVLMIPMVRWLDRDARGSRASRLPVLFMGILPCVAVHVIAFAALRSPDAVNLIGDVHQRGSIHSMFSFNLQTIALAWGWFAVAIGCILAAIVAVAVLAGARLRGTGP